MASIVVQTVLAITTKPHCLPLCFLTGERNTSGLSGEANGWFEIYPPLILIGPSLGDNLDLRSPSILEAESLVLCSCCFPVGKGGKHQLYSVINRTTCKSEITLFLS